MLSAAGADAALWRGNTSTLGVKAGPCLTLFIVHAVCHCERSGEDD